MIMETSLPSLFSTLQSSLESASLPGQFDIVPPANGISLLDLKNDLFLSYLQNLVFLILIKLRHGRETSGDGIKLNEEVTKKLAELRLYLEKGVKPLEGKLKYQIDKVVKAAEDASKPQPAANSATKAKKKKQRRRADESEDSERSSAGESDEDDAASASASEIDELSYRPNPAALMRPRSTQRAQRDPRQIDEDTVKDGIYKPPRITATAMPVTRGKEEKQERQPNKSNTLDEFIATELSTAPVAEPSIGSTIVFGGRRLKTQRERDEDAKKTRYEEDNMIRLPKESTKDKAQKAARNRSAFGGEDWRDLGAGLGRIDALVKRKGGSGSKVERSKKRSFEGSGLGGGDIGRDFEKRKKTVLRRFR